MWIADFLIAALLARMTGSIRSARDYVINPYVLVVSGAWTFDSVMVLGLLEGRTGFNRARGRAPGWRWQARRSPLMTPPARWLAISRNRGPRRSRRITR